MPPIGGPARAGLFVERDGLLQISVPPVCFGQFKVELRARGGMARDGRFEFAEPLIEIRVMLHLRERKIEFALRSFLEPDRIVERHSAAIGRRIAVVLFDEGAARVDCRTRLYEVICYRGVNRVGGPALRHMTRSAILRRRMATRFHEFSNSGPMADLAGFGVAAQRGRSGGPLMRVVAANAAQRSATLHVTGGFAQSVGGADEFDLVFAFALTHPGGFRLLRRAVLYRAGRAVEMQDVIFERLARTIGESSTTVARQISRKFQAGSFQMALHADFHLTVV